MGQTLINGIFLPDEGERNCYTGLAANWRALDYLIGGYNVHVANAVIHVSQADRDKWDAVTGKADASVLTAHTGDTTIHVTAADKTKWDAVTSKADDTDTVHKSGAETIPGQKTFAASIKGYNSDSAQNTVSIDLRTSKVARGNTQDGTDIFSLGFRDKNNDSLMSVSCIKRTSGATAEYHTIYTLDNSDASISRSFSFNLNKDGSGSLQPEENNRISLGTTSKKWAALNGINPGALSLPVIPSSTSFVDISAYITVLDSSSANLYTPPADGYITFDVSGNQIQILHDYGLQYKASVQSGANKGFCPVRGGVQYKIYITASSINKFWFIPCQGNI